MTHAPRACLSVGRSPKLRRRLLTAGEPRPQAFGRMSAPALARFVPGLVLHRPAARRRVAEHRQVTGRACRASPNKSWEPAATRGDSALALRAPQATRTRPGSQTATVPKGRHDNHRPAPRCCYTPVPPRWFSRSCPAPGMTQLQTHALTGQHLWPVLCAPPKGPWAMVVLAAWPWPA